MDIFIISLRESWMVFGPIGVVAFSMPDGYTFEELPYCYRIVEVYDNGDIYTYM